MLQNLMLILALLVSVGFPAFSPPPVTEPTPTYESGPIDIPAPAPTSTPAPTQEPASGTYFDFANCLASKDVKMYGASWCSHCIRQKEMFGPAFEKINYIECYEDGVNKQLDICSAEKITAYPTWEFQDKSRREGKMTFEDLSGKTGCPAPLN